MRIVVTGACGFVGSVLSVRAAELGHEVYALDNGQRGNNRQAIESLKNGWIQTDCMDGIKHALPKDKSIDAVFHLAAATGSLEKPLEELCRFNVGMTEKVYEDARSLGAKAFVWPTTSLALGVPDSPYCESKERGRKWLLEREAKENAPIAAPVRFFNVTGAYKGCGELRKHEVHILPVMMDALLKKKEFVVNGSDYDTVDGTPGRDFVNVLDVVEELLALAEHRLKGTFQKSWAHEGDGTIWLGTGQNTTVGQVLKIFERFVGNAPAHRIAPRRAFDCARLVMDDRQQQRFAKSRGMLVPPWVSIRDEFLHLFDLRDRLDVLGAQGA